MHLDWMRHPEGNKGGGLKWPKPGRYQAVVYTHSNFGEKVSWFTSSSERPGEFSWWVILEKKDVAW